MTTHPLHTVAEPGNATAIATRYRAASATMRRRQVPAATMSSMTDVNNRFVNGDPEALRALYREYGATVYSVAFRVLRDRTLAEDATQHAFLNAWRAADTFDPSRDIGPWLFTIAKRVAIDVYRREKRHLSEELADRDVAIAPHTFEGTWTAWEVRQAIETLPIEERSVLEATHFLGLTHEETGRRLGIPVGTVKSRSHRAYRRLTRLLAHLGEEASA